MQWADFMFRDATVHIRVLTWDRCSNGLNIPSHRCLHCYCLQKFSYYTHLLPLLLLLLPLLLLLLLRMRPSVQGSLPPLQEVRPSCSSTSSLLAWPRSPARSHTLHHFCWVTWHTCTHVTCRASRRSLLSLSPAICSLSHSHHQSDSHAVTCNQSGTGYVSCRSFSHHQSVTRNVSHSFYHQSVSQTNYHSFSASFIYYYFLDQWSVIWQTEVRTPLR